MKKTTAIVAMAALISACITAQQAGAREANNAIHFSGKLHVGRIEAAKVSTVRLTSMKLRGSNLGSTLHMNTRARIGGPITLKNSVQLQVASLNMNNVRIGGPANLQINVQVRNGITGDQGSEIGIGGVQITADDKYNPQLITTPAPRNFNQPVKNNGILASVPGGTIGFGQSFGTTSPANPLQQTPGSSSQVSGGSIDFSKYFEQGHQFMASDGANALGGQCAWFAEQITRLPGGGTWTIGSTVARKRQKLAEHVKNGEGFYSGKATPKAGNAIIFDESYSKWGHVAVINEILPGGKARLTESNLSGHLKVRHDRIVNLSDPSIMGFLNTKPIEQG